MRRNRIHPNSRRRNNEQGVVILLVAVVMLFVIGAMAALSIDVVTLYTARSEAQLAADGAALAAARVLANSGATSDTTGGSMASAWNLAKAVAIQVAIQNKVGGTNLTPAEVTPTGPGGTNTDPTVTVIVQKNDLPTFFARIWGTRTVTVKASATAEAYNPTPNPAGGPPPNPPLPVAPMCVKPWLLPNIDPSNTVTPGSPIFDATSGAITTATLLGWVTPPGGGPGAIRLRTDCTSCTQDSAPTAWMYYPGDPADFPPPSASSVVCPGCAGFTNPNYQLSIAGCVRTPISCSSPVTSPVHIDQTPDGVRDTETRQAVDGLTHSTANEGDSVDNTAVPSPPPFQFLAGADNPVVLSGALAAGTDIMVSDSLVTVPVINVDSTTTLPLAGFPSVRIIGFVQLFLNPTGRAAPPSGRIHTQVINIVGCGTGMAATPMILGNGASSVAVRLISPP